jgi:WD40 repeat protein
LTASVCESTQLTTLDSIILPPTLLSAPPPHALAPYSTVQLPEAARAIAPYPFFDLSNPSTTLVLVSLPDHPIRLTNALSLATGPVASYRYIYPETETFLAPHSLMFTADGTRFLAGCDSELSLFDVSRAGDGPLERYKMKRNGQIGRSGQWRMKRGVVSTMDIVDDVLAVGTLSREIGIFGSNGQGGCIASFELGNEFPGTGVTQVKWSSCGTYLLVGERKSDVIQVFDVRGQHRRVQTLRGRHSNTLIKLGWELTPNGEVWAGGHDGQVRVWDGVGKTEGSVQPSSSWQAHQGSFSFFSFVRFEVVLAPC